MKRYLIILFIFVFSFSCFTGCNTRSTKSSVEKDIEGTWEYYDASIGFGEIMEFHEGALNYNSYVDGADNNNNWSRGTYEITEDNIITDINGYKTYFAYEYVNGELNIYNYISSGADAGSTRVYTKAE